MDAEKPKKLITTLTEMADIKINGTQPFDLQILDDSVYTSVLKDGSLGLGETYMDGLWTCEKIDEMICRLLQAKLDEKIQRNHKLFLRILLARCFNYQTKRRAKIVGKKHYDTGNALFKAMLDNEMNYTCAYFKDTLDLNEAQKAKLDLVCRKIGLEKGMTVLDIGCGFGAFARHAAKNYGAKVLGVTISKEQCKLAQTLSQDLPIEIRFQDYRDVKGTFDRVVSLGMFEHVGHKNYKTFMKVVHRCLKDDGLLLLHTIGSNQTSINSDPWIHKYIFPNGALPSIALIAKAAENYFIMEDWHNFGPDYDKTLMAWHANFEKHWPDLKALYDERFHRMWRYYLLSCAGTFRARGAQLWQIVFSKQGALNCCYASVR